MANPEVEIPEYTYFFNLFDLLKRQYSKYPDIKKGCCQLIDIISADFICIIALI